ncbi:MAG: CaiB/BaiF CoA transferase family protein [Cellvibrionaceae bacterium]
MSNRAPLSGMTIIDFSHVMAGPFCTHTLHTLGARVIKIEKIGEGDVMRHYDQRPQFQSMAPPFIAVNSGKESIALDLKAPETKEIINKLLVNADAVVENFRPGVLERLGFGYDDCKKQNPALIYCSVSGFGQNGPLKNNPAYDHVVQAMSGVMSLNGEPGSKPMKAGFPVLDTFAGYTAAMSIMTALLQRERFGEGQYIDVAMLDASLNLMIAMVAPYLIAGDIPKKVGNRGFNMSPTSDTFQAKKSQISIGANTQKQYESMCLAMEREDLITSDSFSTREARIKNELILRNEIERTTLTKAATDWEILFNKVGVPSAAIRTIPEIVDHPHLEGRGLKLPIDSVLGSSTASDSEQPLGFTLGPGFCLTLNPKNSLGSAPKLGEHTRKLLLEIGYSEDEIQLLSDNSVIQTNN